MAFLLRGTTGGDTNPVGLPPGTQPGDLIVVSTALDAGISDTRFSEITPGMHVGRATTLDAVTIDGSFGCVTLATFSGATVNAAVVAEGTGGGAIAVPVISGQLALLGQGALDLLGTSPTLSCPAGYSAGGGNTAGGWYSSRVDYWYDPAGSNSPTTDAVWSHGGISVRVLSAIPVGTGAPPCRLTGRGDSLGAGSGRIYPPGVTQQSGRLNGPY